MNLEEKIEYLLEENKRLREQVGSWKRKAQDKKAKPRKLVREGYNDYMFHYKVYVIDEIPSDLAFKEVLLYIREHVLPEFFPYEFEKIDYSNHHHAYLLQVKHTLDIDMRFFEKLTIKYQ